MQGPRRCAWRQVAIGQALIVVAGVAITRTAVASSPFQVLEPADYMLSFHQVVSGVPTPIRQIHLRNITSEVATGDVRCCTGEGLVLTGNTPISVNAGQDVSWDLYCLTDDPAEGNSFFDLDYCGSDCDQVSGMLTITITCSPPVMRLSALELDYPATLRGETARQTVAITNLTSGSVTWPLAVTGAAFALVGDGSVALAAGASADITVEFRPTAAGDQTGTLEIGAAGAPDHFAVPLGGTATAPMEEPPGDQVPHHSGGCSATSAPGAAPLLALALLALVRRRRTARAASATTGR